MDLKAYGIGACGIVLSGSGQGIIEGIVNTV
jgi:hypothetical protein